MIYNAATELHELSKQYCEVLGLAASTCMSEYLTTLCERTGVPHDTLWEWRAKMRQVYFREQAKYLRNLKRRMQRRMDKLEV